MSGLQISWDRAIKAVSAAPVAATRPIEEALFSALSARQQQALIAREARRGHKVERARLLAEHRRAAR